MQTEMRVELREYIQKKLIEKGDAKILDDADSLFVSRRLDSLDAMETVVFLEEKFGVDFAKLGFDQNMIDSIDAMIDLIKKTTSGHLE